MLFLGGQDDQPLSARVLDNLWCRPSAWLVVLKQPHDQWHHLACIGTLKVNKPHRAFRRVRKYVKRLHHLRNHLMLLDVGSNNHPVVHPVLNQAWFGLVTKWCFPHPFVQQRLDTAINLVQFAVGQGQHCRGSRLGQGLGQAEFRDQLRDLHKMIRLGPDNQSLRVLVPQNDRISRTGSCLVNLFLVEFLHQRRDTAKLFTIEHLKNARLAGNNWFPPLLKLPHDVISGLNIARRTGHNQASGRGVDGNGQAGPGFTTGQLICSGIRDGLLHSSKVKGLDAKHPGDVHRCDWLWMPSLGASAVHLQNKVLDYLKLAGHRCRGNDAIQLGINNDAGLELGRCRRLALLRNAINSLPNH